MSAMRQRTMGGAGRKPGDAGRRLGPRPLLLYLTAAAAAATGDGAEARAFLDGLKAYWAHPYRRRLADPPVLWSEGRARLLDFGPEDGRPLLVVPSLVNRSYVLDLSQRRSLLRWLAGEGFRPLLLDWGEPGEAELGWSVDDYVTGPLDRALAAVQATSRTKPVVLGYCMGGLLALALAQRRQDRVGGLVLLATPWDFSVTALAAQLGPLGPMQPLLDGLNLSGHVPVGVLEGVFASDEPLQVVAKYAAFSRLAQRSERARSFVAIEDWLADGVPLAAGVARGSLRDWYLLNQPLRGEWRVAGDLVLPQRLDLPALVVAPRRDRIVPAASAAPLAKLLPRAELLEPEAGHVGMVAGERAPDQLWRPLQAWLRRIAAMQE